MTRGFIKIVLCMCFAQITFGQDFAVDMKKMNQAYGANELTIDFEVYLIADEKNTSKKESLGLGKIRKKSDLYFSSFDGQHIYHNEDGVVLIDDKEKSVDYIKRSSKRPESKELTNDQINAMIAMSDTVYFVQTKNGVKHYRIFNESADIRIVDLYMNAKTFFIDKLVYTYKESTKEESFDAHQMEVIYTRNRTKCELKPSYFSTKSILAKGANGKYYYKKNPKYTIHSNELNN